MNGIEEVGALAHVSAPASLDADASDRGAGVDEHEIAGRDGPDEVTSTCSTPRAVRTDAAAARRRVDHLGDACPRRNR